MKGLAMRTLLLGLLAIAIGATATADTVRPSTGSPHRLVGRPIMSTQIGYRFHDRFCRAQYNNQADRNACMMRATGLPLSTTERDDR